MTSPPDTSDLTFTSSPLYTHPTIRSLSSEELHERLGAIRVRRLLVAREFQSNQLKRLDKEGSKLSEKWTKLSARIETRLNKVTDEIIKAEKELEELGRLSNQTSLLE